MESKQHSQILIIGGGVAGLWLLNELTRLGYGTILLEKNRLGEKQSMHSQGIIHGGLKYSLKGFLSQSTDPLLGMPERWKQHLQGKRSPNLSDVEVYSTYQLLFSLQKISSKITSFFASKAVKSVIAKAEPTQLPDLLSHSGFKGNVYRLEEPVLNPQSLIKSLANNLQHLIKLGATNILFEDKKVRGVKINDQIHTADLYIFTAGSGNSEVFANVLEKEIGQDRPLHMVYGKGFDEPIYAHCMDHGSTRVTITSHSIPSTNKYLWYFGGAVAESGVQRNKEAQINYLKNELKTLFPWLDLGSISWGSFLIDRGEMKTITGLKPDDVCIKKIENSLIAWPTKLALTPKLVDQLISMIGFSAHADNHHREESTPIDQLLGTYNWEQQID